MQIVGKTNIGKVRSANEDAIDYGLLAGETLWGIVCDGMGGIHGGKIASNTAVSVIKEKIRKSYNKAMNIANLENVFLSTITTANVIINDMGTTNDDLTGMGTTIVGAFIKNNEVCIAHVGDSRAYLINDAGIRQLTKDHSFVQDMYEKGEITFEEIETHPKKNIITRALGVRHKVEIDFNYRELKEGDTILLCSDGLSGMLNENEILEIYRNTEFRLLADRYIDAANSKGGRDNISVIIMKG